MPKRFLFNYRIKRHKQLTAMGLNSAANENKLIRFFNLSLLVFLAIIIIFPFYFMLSTSLLTDEESFAFQSGSRIIFPTHPQFSNYYKAATISDIDQDYLGALKASSLTAFISVMARLFFTLLFGYAYSLPNWRFKRLSWAFFLILLAVPEAGVLLGQFLIVQRSALKDSLIWVGLNIPFVAHIFSGYLFRNAFESIPAQVKEAAAIDGISRVGFFFKIALPMIRSSILMVVIITTFAAWNAYLWPNIILSNQTNSWKPINIWVYYTGNLPVTSDASRFLLSVRLAGAVLAILPMFIFYFFFRRRIMAAINRNLIVAKG